MLENVTKKTCQLLGQSLLNIPEISMTLYDNYKNNKTKLCCVKKCFCTRDIIHYPNYSMFVDLFYLHIYNSKRERNIHYYLIEILQNDLAIRCSYFELT